MNKLQIKEAQQALKDEGITIEDLLVYMLLDSPDMSIKAILDDMFIEQQELIIQYLYHKLSEQLLK